MSILVPISDLRFPTGVSEVRTQYVTGSGLLVVLRSKNPVGSGLLVRGSSSEHLLCSMASSKGRVGKKVSQVNMAAIYRFARSNMYAAKDTHVQLFTFPQILCKFS